MASNISKDCYHYSGRAAEIHRVVRSRFALFAELPSRYLLALLFGEPNSPFRWGNSIGVFLGSSVPSELELVLISSSSNMSIALRLPASVSAPEVDCSKLNRGLVALLPKLRIHENASVLSKLRSVCLVLDHESYCIAVSPEDFQAWRRKRGVRAGKSAKKANPRSDHGRLIAGSTKECRQAQWFPLARRLGIQRVSSGGLLPSIHPESMSELLDASNRLGLEFMVVPDFQRGIGIVSFYEKKSSSRVIDLVAFVKLVSAPTGLVAHAFVPRWVLGDFTPTEDE